MKNRPDKSDIRLWEYPWYGIVTLVLLIVGLGLLLVAGVMAVVRQVPKTSISIRVIVLVAALIVVTGSAYLYLAYTRTVDLGGKGMVVTINGGDDLNHVIEHLKAQHIIESPRLFRLLVRWKHIDRRLIPGEYTFTGPTSMRTVLEKLQKAVGVQIRVTIYEGAPIWKVAQMLSQQLKLDSAQFLTLAKDKVFLDSLGVSSLEGYLFPETYFFAPGTEIRRVVREMVRMFQFKTQTLWQQDRSGMTRGQLVTLASIVQAESKLASENGRIASVYLNRLRKGMTLDADPTVIYGLGGLDRPLVKKDLDEDTPYNTYRVLGLPPTPINSPGLAALEAAVRPDSTTYLYFVADGSGAHIFSYTNDEHNTMRKRLKMASRRN